MFLELCPLGSQALQVSDNALVELLLRRTEKGGQIQRVSGRRAGEKTGVRRRAPCECVARRARDRAHLLFRLLAVVDVRDADAREAGGDCENKPGSAPRAHAGAAACGDAATLAPRPRDWAPPRAAMASPPVADSQALAADVAVVSAPSYVCVANMVHVLDEPLLRLIFHRLSGWEAARVTGVCRAWRAWLTADSDGWRFRFRRSFFNAQHGLAHQALNVQTLSDEYKALLEQYEEWNSLYGGLLSSSLPLRERLPTPLYAMVDKLQFSVANLVVGEGVPREFQGGDDFARLDAHDVAVFGVRHWWPAIPQRRRRHSAAGEDEPVLAFCAFLGQQFKSLGHAHDCVSKSQAAALRPWVICHQTEPSAPGLRHPDAAQARLLVTGEAMESRCNVVALPPRGAPTAWFALYCAAARSALRGRCVVCQRHVSAGQLHPVLRAPLCSGRLCQETYPVVGLHTVLDGMPPAAVALLTALQKKKARSAYRSAKKRTVRLVLRSSVQAAMMTRGGYVESHAGAGVEWIGSAEQRRSDGLALVHGDSSALDWARPLSLPGDSCPALRRLAARLGGGAQPADPGAGDLAPPPAGGAHHGQGAPGGALHRGNLPG